MNSILSVEGSNFPTALRIHGQQLYYIRSYIRSRILHFYDNIKDRDLSTTSASNLTELYRIFSELDELGHMDIDNEMCELILRDPVIQPLRPVIHASYSNFFSLHETQLAQTILVNENPWGMLGSFPLYPRYESLINVHIQNSPKIKVLAFIGCGPLPVTLLLFSKLYGIRCIGIDKNPEAVALAKSCIKHFGLEKEISILEGDETALSKVEWDSVLIAGLAEPKQRIFRNLHSMIKNRKSGPEKSASVCYRNYSGMRQLLYWPVPPEQIKGFRKIKEIYPSGKVNNTLVFLECE